MPDSDPHNYRKVGYAMITVAASLTAIALVGLAIGEDVLYADKIQRAKTAHFEECKETGFAAESCQPYEIHMKFEECVADRSLDDEECYKYRTWVEAEIFEECRVGDAGDSPLCAKYEGLY